MACREGAAALRFGLAGLLRGDCRLRHTAFALGLGLWAASLLADEVFITYALGGTHLRLLAARLATLLALRLLPGATDRQAPVRRAQPGWGGPATRYALGPRRTPTCTGPRPRARRRGR